jgi:hypothetical protein
VPLLLPRASLKYQYYDVQWTLTPHRKGRPERLRCPCTPFTAAISSLSEKTLTIVAGVLDEPYNQLSTLSGVAIPPARLHRMNFQPM